ncbi:hypothetical protein Gotur_018310 [Gossypium turneri]
MVLNQNINLTELRKRIRRKIFETTPIKVLSTTYQFCSSVDPVTYDSFDVKGPRSLEAIVQTHFASEAPNIELYVQFTSPNDALVTAVREVYTTPARHSVSGLQNTEQPMFGNGMKYTSTARHSVSGWDMHLGGSMFDAGNTYWERHQLLVVGNLHPIRDVMKRLEEGMMYSLRRPPVRGPRTLQMMVG